MPDEHDPSYIEPGSQPEVPLETAPKPENPELRPAGQGYMTADQAAYANRAPVTEAELHSKGSIEEQAEADAKAEPVKPEDHGDESNK